MGSETGPEPDDRGGPHPHLNAEVSGQPEESTEAVSLAMLWRLVSAVHREWMCSFPRRARSQSCAKKGHKQQRQRLPSAPQRLSSQKKPCVRRHVSGKDDLGWDNVRERAAPSPHIVTADTPPPPRRAYRARDNSERGHMPIRKRQADFDEGTHRIRYPPRPHTSESCGNHRTCRRIPRKHASYPSLSTLCQAKCDRFFFFF